MSKTAHPQRPEPWGQSPEEGGAASGSAGPTPPGRGRSPVLQGSRQREQQVQMPPGGGKQAELGSGEGSGSGFGQVPAEVAEAL